MKIFHERKLPAIYGIHAMHSTQTTIPEQVDMVPFQMPSKVKADSVQVLSLSPLVTSYPMSHS